MSRTPQDGIDFTLMKKLRCALSLSKDDEQYMKDLCKHHINIYIYVSSSESLRSGST